MEADAAKTFATVEVFPWVANFETGIPEIDDQHRQLVGLLNELVGHLAFQSDAPTLNRVFGELTRYAVVHFRTEEAIWHRHLKEDPWAASHRQAHSDFVARVVALKAEESRRSLDEVIEDIVTFLTHWLAFHILESDKRMAMVALAMPTGMSLEQAKKLADESMTGAARTLIDTVMGMYDKLASRTVELTREIYRRGRAEEELRLANQALAAAMEEAEAANRAKSAFVTNVSHELRAPLGAIGAKVRRLQQDGPTPAQAARLGEIDAVAQHLLGVVNGVLDLARIEAGKFALAEAPVSPDLVVGEVAAMLAERARDGGLELVVLPAETRAAFVGDPVRIRQALLNYATNALKFTPRGSVTLACRRVEESDADALLRFEVQDTGIGLAPEDAARVFGAYEQVPGLALAAAAEAGTGLGLAITRQLAELMGGEAGVESAPGAGSRFWFTVRLRKAAAAGAPVVDAPPASAAPPVAGDRQRVLLAEDDPVNLEVALGMLADLPLAVETAADGEAAVELASRNDYALILMDMRMPRMDGAEATRRIRALPGRSDVPILAMTANAFAEDRRRCLDAGMNDVITKPIDPELLRRTLGQWLGW